MRCRPWSTSPTSAAYRSIPSPSPPRPGSSSSRTIPTIRGCAIFTADHRKAARTARLSSACSRGRRRCLQPVKPADAAGFTYIGLLIAVVVLGIALSAVGTVWRTQAQREREQELLFIGHEFQRAIAAYYRAG